MRWNYGIVALLIICGISSSFGWIHDAKVFGLDLVNVNVLPVNYLFFQLTDVYGRNITTVLEDDQKLVTYSLNSNTKYCRVSTDKIYTGDGIFVIRFRYFETCEAVELSIRYRGRHLSSSPYCFKSFSPENCNCPKPLTNVLKDLQCPENIDQIDKDLEPFSRINFVAIKKQISESFNNFKSVSICNYVINNNEIFRKCFGKYTGFKMFMDAILISLVNKVKLPNTEFFVNLGDWPLINNNKKLSGIPMFSWCGNNETLDIVMPTYDITEATINMLHRVSLDMLSVQRENYPWAKKIEKGFFRGRDSRRERLDLVDISKHHPDLLNASITNFFFFNDEEYKYGPKVKHISFMDFFEYKYQINVDGTVSAYRFPYLLAGNSVVLKQESPYYEHFYGDLIPHEHYIPIERDVREDLIHKIKWLKQNDAHALRIMRNSRDFVRKNLMPSNIYCYHLKLIEEFTKRITSEIVVDPEMEKVDTKSIDCNCN